MTEIRRGWFNLASGAGIGRVLSFVSNLLLSRLLGPADLGLFNLVTTTVQASDTLVRCGGDYALNYELGGEPEPFSNKYGVQLARGLVHICSSTTIILCIALAIWIWFGQALFPISIQNEQRLIMTGMLVLMVACEGLSSSAWELLLVNHCTAKLALRQGLFFPLRLISAALASSFSGILGAISGVTLICIVQLFCLKHLLGASWNPLHIWPFAWNSALKLLRRGGLFYVTNLLASTIFYPLLLQLAAGSGLAEVGYLRVGQILQQLFAFLPATLVPVLFLSLRGQPSFLTQVQLLERPLRIIWFVLLEVLLIYCIFDDFLIRFFFGDGFSSALLPTRLLLITALFECLAQLIIQPILASGKVSIYSLWQNGSAISAAILGWFWIPSAGLAAYLMVRLLYVTLPLLGLSLPVIRCLRHPWKIVPLALSSLVLLGLFISSLFYVTPSYLGPLLATSCVFIFILHLQDALFIRDVLVNRRS